MSGHLRILDTPLTGLHTVQRQSLGDSRGFLERLYCTEELKLLLSGRTILQINHTMTVNKATVRGLHYQMPPCAETKFVSCLRGEVFDVAVDLRTGSPTYLHWHAEVLSDRNHKTLVIPEGFAHGFQTLSDNCDMLYFHTKAYQPAAERGLSAMDPRLLIDWPLPVGEQSIRDSQHPLIDDTFEGVVL